MINNYAQMIIWTGQYQIYQILSYFHSINIPHQNEHVHIYRHPQFIAKLHVEDESGCHSLPVNKSKPGTRCLIAKKWRIKYLIARKNNIGPSDLIQVTYNTSHIKKLRLSRNSLCKQYQHLKPVQYTDCTSSLA